MKPILLRQSIFCKIVEHCALKAMRAAIQLNEETRGIIAEVVDEAIDGGLSSEICAEPIFLAQ
jgi:hypothetical protein